MFRLLRVIVALGIMFGWASQATAQIAAQSPVIPPRSFALKAGDIPGWIVARVNTSRRESNWRAWHDSHPPAQYIYRGSWAGLGRTIGWYERLLLHSGPADAVTTVLVSEFSDRDAAALAYAAITKSLPLGPFSAGSRAGEWQPSAGIGSGMQGCASRFGTFVDIVQYGAVVAEISSHVSQLSCSALPSPGQTIARKLVRIIRAAAISVVSSRTIAATRSVNRREYVG